MNTYLLSLSPVKADPLPYQLASCVRQGPQESHQGKHSDFRQILDTNFLKQVKNINKSSQSCKDISIICNFHSTLDSHLNSDLTDWEKIYRKMFCLQVSVSMTPPTPISGPCFHLSKWTLETRLCLHFQMELMPEKYPPKKPFLGFME